MRTLEERAILRQAAAIKSAERKASKREHRAKVEPVKRDRGRERDPGFLAYLRRQPCRVGPVGCNGPIQAAHLRYSDAKHGRVNSGLQCKPSDQWATSLCAGHHAEQHAAGDERAWWASHGLDGSEVALAQYRAYGAAK